MIEDTAVRLYLERHVFAAWNSLVCPHRRFSRKRCLVTLRRVRCDSRVALRRIAVVLQHLKRHTTGLPAVAPIGPVLVDAAQRCHVPLALSQLAFRIDGLLRYRQLLFRQTALPRCVLIDIKARGVTLYDCLEQRGFCCSLVAPQACAASFVAEEFADGEVA